MTIVNKLKEYRNLRRLTQEELSNSSGISIRTIQRIEKGLSTGSPHTIKTLAKTLNIESVDLLVAGENQNELVIDELGKLRLMNLSILTVILIPLGNLLFPTLIFLFNKKAKKVNTLGRKIISFQILSTLFLFLSTIILFIVFGRGNGAIPMPVFICYLIYVLICSITVIHSAIGINNGKEILKFAPRLI